MKRELAMLVVASALGVGAAGYSDDFLETADTGVVKVEKGPCVSYIFTNAAAGKVAVKVRTSHPLVDVLVVGGGGGGAGGCGGRSGGGGGGGGVVYRKVGKPVAGDLAVTVGAGGKRGAAHYDHGGRGANSALALAGEEIVAQGGGGGQAGFKAEYPDQGPCGSTGGGACLNDKQADLKRFGIVTKGQGYAGGAAENWFTGGGGGGAAERGYAANDTEHPSQGGDGFVSDISGTAHAYGSGGGSGGRGRLYYGGAEGGLESGGGGGGEDGVDGLGGGGGSDLPDATANGAEGGRGGSGTVVLRFRTDGQSDCPAPGKLVVKRRPRPVKEDFLGNTKFLSSPSLKYIQRTMKKIAASTKENPATVRILFYGQSITAQEWTQRLMAELKEKYPTVRFIWENRAIGGYETPMLRDVWKWDVPTFYPDLLFFHDYGHMDQYEEMVRWAREQTAAEIVLWTSHISHGKPVSDYYPTRDERSRRILEVAAKYHCHVIDLNLKWAKLLIEKNLGCNALLADGIHLNSKGIRHYQRFIEEEILRLPDSDGDETATGRDRVVPVAGPEGPVTFAFTGNRVTAISDGTGDAALKAEVLLDGKPLAGQGCCWAFSRPSASVCWWMPGAHQLDFRTTPVAEDWTVTFLAARPGDPTGDVLHKGMGVPDAFAKFPPIRFKVTGSVTGEDGEGISTEPFESNSGRVVLPVRAWVQFPWWKQNRPKPGATVKWKAYPLFADTLTAKKAGEETLLLQGCANAAHTLTIKVPPGVRHGIRAFHVWTPAEK